MTPARRARLGPHHGSAGETGDLYALTVVGLARVALVEQLDVEANELVVVPLDLVELLGDVHSVVVGHLDVTTLDDDVHA